GRRATRAAVDRASGGASGGARGAKDSPQPIPRARCGGGSGRPGELAGPLKGVFLASSERTVSDDIRIAPCREAELPALMRFIGMAAAWLSHWFAVPEYRARNVATRLILAVRGLGLEVLGAVGANDVSKKALLSWG